MAVLIAGVAGRAAPVIAKRSRSSSDERRSRKSRRETFGMNLYAEKVSEVIWSNYSDLTRPGPPKGSKSEGKSPSFREI